MGIKTTLSLLVAVGIGGYFYFAPEPEEVVDTRFNNAYQLSDGSLVTISASTSERLRLLHIDTGQPQSLYHYGKTDFELTNGFRKSEPIANGEFQFDEQGAVLGATLNVDGETQQLTALPLKHEEIYFKSGDLTLRGKLSLPEGEGPFPVVIMIHGSEDYSAVDYYAMPYMLAANGIAGFKFDKRGTGKSEGDYTQHFPTLAGDVIAAINMLSERNDIDPQKVNLAGFSQGGWIAPLVAKQTDIRSIMVGFGTTVRLYREDRWGYVKRLLEHGYGDEEVTKADEINDILRSLMIEQTDAQWERLFSLVEQYRATDWFSSISGSDSLLGVVVSKVLASSYDYTPEFAWKAYFWYRTQGSGDNFNRDYDSIDTLNAIDTPSLWLLAGEDSSLPSMETVEQLTQLKAQGKPVNYQVYAGAEHGNVLFEFNDDNSKRYIQYVPSYFNDTIDWFKQQNGLM